jgi:hypothetical protein
MEKRPVAGTLIRGADGKLYFIPDAILAPYQITEHQADLIGPVIGDAPTLRLPLAPEVLEAYGLSVVSETHGIGESEIHGKGAVAKTDSHTPDKAEEGEEEEEGDKDEEEDTGMGDAHRKPAS